MVLYKGEIEYYTHMLLLAICHIQYYDIFNMVGLLDPLHPDPLPPARDLDGAFERVKPRPSLRWPGLNRSKGQ